VAYLDSFENKKIGEHKALTPSPCAWEDGDGVAAIPEGA